jgi:uncharacterized protein (TIGR03083 family)
MDPRHAPSRAELIDIWQTELETIADLASTLDDEQWSALTPCPGWSVGDLVAHTTDIEQMLARDPRPEHEPDWASLPHAAGDIGRFTEIGVDWRRGRAKADVIEELRATTRSRRATLEAVPDGGEVLSPFGRPTTIERLVSMRILDAWVHEQDIREAIGQPGGMDSDAAILTLQQFVGGLPKVWAKQTQAPSGSTVHLVIADVGRGVEAWASVEADGQGATCDPVPNPTVTLTLTWTDYLALSAGRVGPDSVAERVTVAGDSALGKALLSSMVQTP